MASLEADPLELEIEASSVRVAPSLALEALSPVRSCLVAVRRHLEFVRLERSLLFGRAIRGTR